MGYKLNKHHPDWVWMVYLFHTFQQHQLLISWGLWWISRGSTLWEYHTTSQAELQLYSFSLQFFFRWMYMSVVVNALSYMQVYCTVCFFNYTDARLLISYYLALRYIFVLSRDVNLAWCFIKMLLAWFCLVSCRRYLGIFVSEAVFALQPRRFPMTAALKLDGNYFTIDVVYRTHLDCHDGCYYI